MRNGIGLARTVKTPRKQSFALYLGRSLDPLKKANFNLVTGGTGIVGRAVEEVVAVESLISEHWVYVGHEQADLTNCECTKALFENLRPTMVINTAAFEGGLFSNMVREQSCSRCTVSMAQ